jgi:hypothetical protein
VFKIMEPSRTGMVVEYTDDSRTDMVYLEYNNKNANKWVKPVAQGHLEHCKV